MKHAMLALAAIAALAGSAGEAKRPRAVYTRAALSGLTTAELARLLFGPALAAGATGHVIEPPDKPGGPLTGIHFNVPLRPVGRDLCARERPTARFTPITRKGVAPPGDAPSRIVYTTIDTRLAVAPDCRTLPGQRFMVPIPGLPDEKSVEILRSLVAAQAAAAAPGPLPFKLSCHDHRSRAGDKCGSDPRALLASLPLTDAFRIDRSDYGHAGAFIVWIGDPAGVDEDMPFWQIELNAMGTGQAEVEIAWTVRTLE
jgi:hypothetical protein